MTWRTKLNRGLKKKYGKKRGNNIKRTQRKLTISRPMKTKTYVFKRMITESFNLTTPPSHWDVEGSTTNPTAITCKQVFTLSDLGTAEPGSYQDFTKLFAMYKINAVGIKMYFSSTSVDQVASSGDQIMIYTSPNKVGRTDQDLSEAYFLANQSTKIKTAINAGGRPYNLYCRVRQLSQLYASSANTDYATVKPRYVSSGEALTPHYGVNMRLQLVNDLGISRTAVKILYTYYITCKQCQ